MSRYLNVFLVVLLAVGLVVRFPIPLILGVFTLAPVFLLLGVLYLAGWSRPTAMGLVLSCIGGGVAVLSFFIPWRFSRDSIVILRAVIPPFLFACTAWCVVRPPSFWPGAGSTVHRLNRTQRLIAHLLLPLLIAAYLHIAFYHFEVFDEPFESCTGIAISTRDGRIPGFVVLGILPPFVLLRRGARALCTEIGGSWRWRMAAAVCLVCVAATLHFLVCSWHLESARIADDYTNPGILYVRPRPFGRWDGLAPPGIYARLGRNSAPFSIPMGILLPIMLCMSAWFLVSDHVAQRALERQNRRAGGAAVGQRELGQDLG